MTPTWQEFLDFHNTSIDITVKATITADSVLTNGDATIPVNIVSTILANCYSSVIDAVSMSPVVVELSGGPIQLLIPAITDSGTTTLSTTPGFTTDTCGDFTVTQ